MLWSDFVDLVEEHLAVEASRRGLETFRSRYMKNAVVDLQRDIRGYRQGNTTEYTAEQLTAQGTAQLGELPFGAIPKALYIYSTDTDIGGPLCARYRLQFYPWNSRQDLICGGLNFATWWGACWPEGNCPPMVDSGNQADWFTKAYVYTFSPMGRNFLIYPQVTASTRLLLVWDGIKNSFQDSDDVPLPADAAECVAAYVSWKIARTIDKNIALSREFEADWRRLRMRLYTDFREKFDILPEDEEYDTDVIAPPTNFSEFGGQSIPFLRNITALTGTGNNALAAIGTSSLDLPTTVMIKIGGVLQIWVLEASADPTGPGVTRGNDYSPTNLRAWIQLA